MPHVLLLLSLALAAWGALGLLEYAYPKASLGLQNPNFPAGLQFLHFFAILITGLVFLLGYVTRWPPTPFATVTMYAILATLCFVETVDFHAFGGGTARFLPMLLEYSMYTVLSAYLLKSQVMRRRFAVS